MSQRLRLEQTENIERVSTKIARYVVAFVEARRAFGKPFTAEELRLYVVDRIGAAPGSVDRVLREQRQKGRLNYKVIDRKNSLYEPLPVDAA